MKTKLLGLLAGIGICALPVQPAAAASISFSTSRSGFDDDGPLAASAAFTTSAGLLSVTITNGLSPIQIRDAGQTVSGLTRRARLEPRAPRVNWPISGTPAKPSYTTCPGIPCDGWGKALPHREAQVLSALKVTPSRWRRSGAVSMTVLLNHSAALP